MLKTKVEISKDLKRLRLEKLTEKEAIQRELKEITERRVQLNSKLELIDSALLNIDIKHAKLNVGNKEELLKSNNISKVNKHTIKVNNRIKYDLECVYLMLKMENRWLRVSELCSLLNERMDMPSYCEEYDTYKFSGKIGVYLSKDDRFQVKKLDNSMYKVYGLVGWEEDYND